MTDQIHSFRTSHIAFFRPIKKSYFVLHWNNVVRKWVCNSDPLENLRLYRSTVSLDGKVRINVATRAGSRSINTEVKSSGYFLESGLTQITIVEKVGYQLPSKFMISEYTVVDTPLTHVDVELWTVAPPPPLGPVPVPQASNILKALPKRIAWLIAEDSSKAEDTCPISTEVISPVTAAVTTCFHVFDNASIEQWFTMNPVNTKCPVCREVCLMTKAFS